MIEILKFIDDLKEKYQLSSQDLISLSLSYALKNCDLPIIGFKSLEHVDQILNMNNNIEKYEEVVHEFSLF